MMVCLADGMVWYQVGMSLNRVYSGCRNTTTIGAWDYLPGGVHTLPDSGISVLVHQPLLAPWSGDSRNPYYMVL